MCMPVDKKLYQTVTLVMTPKTHHTTTTTTTNPPNPKKMKERKKPAKKTQLFGGFAR